MLSKMIKPVAVLSLLLASVSHANAQSSTNKVGIAQGADSFIYLPAYVAKAKNYFAEEGLDGTITVYRGGVEALSGVISGASQIYLGPPSTAMKAIVKGQDLKTYGAVLSQVPTNIVVQGDVAKKKNITSASSMADKLNALRGLTMGINSPGSASDQLLRYTAKLAGIDPDREMKISPVGADAALIASFEQKRIDGFAWPSPASDLAIKKFGGVMVVNFAKGEYEPLRGFLYVSLISRTDWLTENPDRAVKVVRAFGKAQRLINEKPEEARAALRTFFPNMDEAAFNDGFEANAVAIPSSLRIDPRSVELTKTFAESVENIKLDVDIKNVYTNAYVDRAEAGK